MCCRVLLPVAGKALTFHGVHHVALICSDLERSLEFYQGVLGERTILQHTQQQWCWGGPISIFQPRGTTALAPT